MDRPKPQEAVAADRTGAAVTARSGRDRSSDDGIGGLLNLLDRNRSLDRRLSGGGSRSLGVGVGVDRGQGEEGKRALDVVGRHYDMIDVRRRRFFKIVWMIEVELSLCCFALEGRFGL